MNQPTFYALPTKSRHGGKFNLAKIDYKELKKLVDEGKNQKEIARVFSCDNSTVCKAIKRLNLAITPKVVQKAGEIVEEKISVINRLERTCRTIDEQLVQIQAQEELGKQDRELIIKCCAEARKQIELIFDIQKELVDVEANRIFREEVLQAIGEESPDTRRRILDRLQKRQLESRW